METKRKDKLLKIYCDIVNENSFWETIDDYQEEVKKDYHNFINGIISEEEKVHKIIKSLNTSKDIVYLGTKEAIIHNDYSYLDKALNTYKKITMLKFQPSGYDHCISTWNLLPIIMVLNSFDDIQTVYPRECGLSKNGMAFLKVATNLMMYLYYQEEAWQEQVIKETEKYLTKKDNLEFQSIVKALYSLVNKDFIQFSSELDHVCEGRKKSKQYGENKFSKEFSFYSLGLYNFAKFLYPNDIDKIIVPENENYLVDYLQYQLNNNQEVGSYLIDFDEQIPILKKLFFVEIPTIKLMKVGRNFEVDCKRFNEELTKRIIKMN